MRCSKSSSTHRCWQCWHRRTLRRHRARSHHHMRPRRRWSDSHQYYCYLHHRSPRLCPLYHHRNWPAGRHCRHRLDRRYHHRSPLGPAAECHRRIEPEHNCWCTHRYRCGCRRHTLRRRRYRHRTRPRRHSARQSRCIPPRTCTFRCNHHRRLCCHHRIAHRRQRANHRTRPYQTSRKCSPRFDRQWAHSR